MDTFKVMLIFPIKQVYMFSFLTETEHILIFYPKTEHISHTCPVFKPKLNIY